MSPRPDNISVDAENKFVSFISEAQVKVKFTLGVRYSFRWDGVSKPRPRKHIH